MSILRPYQRAGVEAMWAALSPDVNRVAMEMATGLGKTVTFAAMIDEWLVRTGTQDTMADRALVLVHTDELVRQAVATIESVTRGRWTIGVVKASRDEVDADIIVASVATLIQPGRKERIQDVGLIVVDEAHHAVAKSYVDILEHYGAWCEHPEQADCPNGNHATPVLGFTATLSRTDGQGLGRVWQDMPFSRSLPWGIRHGYLIDLVPYTIKIPGVDAGASDAVLDAQLAESIAPEAVVQAWLDEVWHPARERGQGEAVSTVLFAPLVCSAEAFAAAFNAAGIKAEVVAGALGDEVNRAVLERYEAGVTTVVCNAMKLTEGWNSPRSMCVIVARPTQSVPLFVQMVGRGLRPWLDAEAPPREDQRCVLLCVAGATTDLATVADLSDKIGEARDGVSLLAMEDEWDIGRDIEPDEDTAYRGPVRVEQWDAIVQASSKAWKHTDAGVPFLPTRKRSEGYVFVVATARGYEVWSRDKARGAVPALVQRVATAPDLELAMGLAEDEAQERGGDIGALLADKTRPWRKAVPSLEMISQARRVGVPEDAITKILESRAGGKAGKLSDLIDRVTATRVLDRSVTKIKERGSRA